MSDGAQRKVALADALMSAVFFVVVYTWQKRERGRNDEKKGSSRRASSLADSSRENCEALNDSGRRKKIPDTFVQRKRGGA